MGTSIAAATIKGGLPVLITDADPDALAAAPAKVAADLTETDGPPDPQAEGLVARLLEPTTEAARIAACDLVLESVVENPAVKHEVYAGLEPLMRPEAILATNTSAIPIGRLAAGLARPGAFCGVHFCHPVRRRPLVEIVRGPQSAPATIAAVVAYACAIGKIPVVVDDGPGFLVNRLLAPYLNGALDLLLEGAGIEEVDQAMSQFGMAMGPLRMIDEVGIDTSMQGGRVLRDAFPQRVLPSPLLVSMVKAGRFGRKSGAGFYVYPAGTGRDDPGQPDPGARNLVSNWVRTPRPHSPEAIVHRLLLPTVLEATRILEEKRVRDAGEIDLTMIFGLGFPAARGGLLYWADTLGASQIIELLEPFSPLGELAQPTPLLLEMARDGRRFYGST